MQLGWDNLFCKLLGHVPYKIDCKNLTATCDRCGVGLEITYDLYFGETVVTGVRSPESPDDEKEES